MADLALKQPPKSAIQAGYYLTKARKMQEEVQKALLEALEYATAARNEIVETGAAFYMEVSPGLKLIGDAIASCHTAGAAHAELRRVYLSKGFREITNEDFAKYGSGGNR